MPVCRKCAYPLDEGETSERCPNCGALLREREPEPVLPVALGTVWRRGAGEATSADTKDPDPAIPEERRAGPGDRSQEAGPKDRSPEPASPEERRAGPGDRSQEAGPKDRPAEPASPVVKPSERPSAPLFTSLPRAAVPGAPRAARRGTGFYPAVPDEPVKPAVFAPPRAAEAVSKDRSPIAAPIAAPTGEPERGPLAVATTLIGAERGGAHALQPTLAGSERGGAHALQPTLAGSERGGAHALQPTLAGRSVAAPMRCSRRWPARASPRGRRRSGARWRWRRR